MISFRFGACSTLTTTLTVDSLKYEGKSLFKIQSFAFIEHGTSFRTFHCLRLRGHVANQNVFADIYVFCSKSCVSSIIKTKTFLETSPPSCLFLPRKETISSARPQLLFPLSYKHSRRLLKQEPHTVAARRHLPWEQGELRRF